MLPQELIEYIHSSRAAGVTDAGILHALADAGWAGALMQLDDSVMRAVNLIKTYEGDTNALNGVSLSIQRGESVAIVGKSGSGKSTLMHILATLDKPTSGELIIDGRATSELTRADIDTLRNKKFGFVFQQFFLNGRNTCLDNVTLPLTIMGISRGEREQRGMEMLKAVGLEEKSKQRAGELSGGQKQRLCIGRALISNPGVIFADEPTGNLDSENSAMIMAMVLELQRSRGITLILVTHDADLAAMCDRIITIKDGHIV
ncbi:MAG: ABC transporter ATP-binding protein [Patescibacteria group bacterium]